MKKMTNGKNIPKTRPLRLLRLRFLYCCDGATLGLVLFAFVAVTPAPSSYSPLICTTYVPGNCDSHHRRLRPQSILVIVTLSMALGCGQPEHQ